MEQLNQRSSGYNIGGLQQLRAQLKGRRHSSSKKIFSVATTFENWAFHHGGRTELQFNIGFETREGVEYLRHGVAFSLETSRSLPSIDVLIPKIRLFNEFVGQNTKSLSDFRMWHFNRGDRFPEHQPSAIPEDLFERGFFIFLGAQQPRRDYDIEVILSDFDRLLPLYKFVESGGRFTPYHDSPHSFRFRAGNSAKRKTTTALIMEANLSIALRERTLQDVLFDDLCREFGRNRVGTELPNGSGGRIDAVVQTKTGYIYFEIKAGRSLQGCIRDAIGQLLEYSYWPGSQQAESLMIVGEAVLDDEGQSYLNALARNSHSL